MIDSSTLQIQIQKRLQNAQNEFNLVFNCRLERPGVLTLFGPSGAGKTSVLRVLAGLSPVDKGKIVVDGEVWLDSERRINVSTQKRSIGMVFQNYALFPHLNVRENIMFAAERHAAVWVDSLLAMMDLSRLQKSSVQQLSGGQKQRVALARALARRPKLLLLDEPLSALDQAMRNQLQDDLMRLQEELMLTVVMVSHDISEVFRMSQEVVQLGAGKVVKNGSPHEVFLKERLSGKLHLQAQILAIRQEEIVFVLLLLIGQEIIEIIVSPNEANGLKVGEKIAISSKTFSPQILRQS